MKIISLEPAVTDLLFAFGLGESIAGVSLKCTLPEAFAKLPAVTFALDDKRTESFIYPELCSQPLNLDLIKSLKPDLILTSIYRKPISEDIIPEYIQSLQSNLSSHLGFEVKIVSYAPRNLEEIYEEIKKITRILKVPAKGIEHAGKIKAQLMNWADNFYERIKNKKATFISSIEPLKLGGFWIPDMIKLFTAHSQMVNAGTEDKLCSWDDILNFRPDVIIIAPRGYSLQESMVSFKAFEKRELWEDIPAVKRGEVIFADGAAHFYAAGNNILDSAAILVSALAGFEGGYITPRDSFYRLRWLELQRHKL